MNIGRHVNKLSLVRKHRQTHYLYTLDKLFEGRTNPNNVTLRYRKLKAVKK